MPSSRERRVARAQQARTSLDAEWMVHLARTLASSEPDDPTELAELFLLTWDDTDDPGSGGTAIQIPLTGEDPVLDLYCRNAPPSVDAVAVVSPSRARRLDDEEVIGRGPFVHLLGRDGISVTVVPPSGGEEARTIGPTPEAQVGRIPDACRRMFGLPTAPPSADTTDLMVDMWLDRVLRSALVDPGAPWPRLARDGTAILRLHPALPADVLNATTPAGIARLLCTLGTTLPWSTFHQAAIDDAAQTVAEEAGWAEDGDDWFDDLAGRHLDDRLCQACMLSWMDVGMFSRHTDGERLARHQVLSVLEELLPPAVLDQVSATIALARTAQPEETLTG